MLGYWWCFAESHASHTIMSDCSRYEFFCDRPAAEFLCKFCNTLGSYLGVGATGLMKWMRSLSWNIVSLDDKELNVWWETWHAFIANFLLNPMVKEFYKSANICQSGERIISLVFFYDAQCIIYCTALRTRGSISLFYLSDCLLF